MMFRTTFFILVSFADIPVLFRLWYAYHVTRAGSLGGKLKCDNRSISSVSFLYTRTRSAIVSKCTLATKRKKVLAKVLTIVRRHFHHHRVTLAKLNVAADYYIRMLSTVKSASHRAVCDRISR